MLSKVRVGVYAAFDYANGLRVDPKEGLVVNGFWRSGTTWVLETAMSMLEAKTVFEPFRIQHLRQCLREIHPPRKDVQFISSLMPYASDRLVAGTALYAVVEQALLGQLAYSHVSKRSQEQRRLKECLRTRVVTKFTRGALCLRAIANTFSVPILHITRDPRAVIASIKTLGNDFARGAFQNFALRAHLLEVDDGRREYFKRWASDIEAIDKTNDFGRIAAYYCLTERHVLDSFQGVTSEFAHVQYEKLIGGGPQALAALLESLGLEAQALGATALLRPSSTDWSWSQGSKKVSGEQRVSSWKNKLSESERGLIEAVVTAFGMQERLLVSS
ncbi:sulfotransferase [Gloeobacter violaceus]|nr:sulfotransferase [Gloeobacter violaceus]